LQAFALSPLFSAVMDHVMQPLLVAAVPEILHLEAKPSFQRTSVASTSASSRSASLSDPEEIPARPIRRSKTVGGIDTAELDMEYPSGLGARDSDDTAPLRRSKTSPGLDGKDLGDAYPRDLVVRNTFLEFVEEPVFLQLRRVKSAPSSPVAGKVAELTPPAPAVLELASMLETTPMLGSPELPTVGSAQHRLGECKPCAFFWKPAGCSNGVDCVYCHLCDAHEKKRRQKEKKALIKAQIQSSATAK
jgi:hypothetical protein